jgi:SAM-dependent methyltransferase
MTHVQSNNPRWSREAFHANIIALAAPSDGDQVLDAGCGCGATLPALLETVGKSGKVVGTDLLASSLTVAADTNHLAVTNGTLELQQADLAKELPFQSGSFDAVICQNVLECVPDKIATVKELWRVLKPGGRLLLAHHDFDAVILNSPEANLTRKLIHGFADQASWLTIADGGIGRKLPGIVCQAGIDNLATGTELYVDLKLEPDTYAYDYLSWLRAGVLQMTVSETEFNEWYAGLEKISETGGFYFAIPWTYVAADK